MSRPVLLDLFCGAGGAAMGYHRAGFDVVGVDINPQPNYPFEFHQADATLVYPTNFCAPGCWHISGASVADSCLGVFDAIHASPPCQGYSAMSSCRPGLADEYPKLIEPVRDLLNESGLPWVIENVVGAPLNDPVMLCGRMFGYEVYRHRLFESNMALIPPAHAEHTIPASKAGHWKPGTVMSVAGHFAPMWKAKEIMGIDWMNRDELGEAIPPAYTEWVGTRLMEQLRAAA